MGQFNPPGPLIVPSGGRFIINWTFGALTLHSVFGMSGVVAGSLTNSLATTMFTALKANAAVLAYMARVQPTGAIAGLTLIDLNPPGNLGGGVATGTALPGTAAAGDMLTVHMAICVTQYTNLKGKSYRGRTFMPLLGEADEDVNGNIVTTTNTLAVNFVNGVKTVIAAQSPLALAVVSPELLERPKKNGTLLPPKAAHVEPVTTITSRNITWSSQRQRGRRK